MIAYSPAMAPGRTIEGTLGDAPVRVAVVCSSYNAWVTDRLLEGAREEFAARTAGRDGVDDDLVVVRAPGAFELAVLAAAAIETERFDAVVALGCVIRGQTRHDRIIADAIARTLSDLAAESLVPVGLGVITAEDADQAEARAGGPYGNKGVEAMAAAMETVGALRALLADSPGGV